MITRVVKLHFREENLQDFLTFFDGISSIVNNFPGCRGMKLYQDVHKPSIVFTYSHWDSEQDLENYRLSNEFSTIWPSIKIWFAAKPEAWTIQAYFDGFAEKGII